MMATRNLDVDNKQYLQKIRTETSYYDREQQNDG